MAFVCHPRKKCAFHSKMCSSELSRRRVSKGKWPWRIRRAAMRRILAQARIELIQLSRDRLSLVFVFALPLILLITFGSGLSLTVSHLPIIVQDLDGSTVSRQFADAFRASNSLYIISWPTDRQLQIYGPGCLRPVSVDVRPLAGLSGDGKGERDEDHPSGLCVQHPGY